jgi:hypothetical protein
MRAAICFALIALGVCACGLATVLWWLAHGGMG